ncbi:uncharacterized protein [Porites lutea]|uniref:uncharacterized protein n=1 Tax=Porites lutea TaxID=51062 RepID=UPI003CC50747
MKVENGSFPWFSVLSYPTTGKASDGTGKPSLSSSQQETPTLASQPSDVSSGIPNQNVDSFESTILSDFLPSGRGFKIAGLNINSLTKHIDELRILLADRSIDILSINETKLDDSINSCEVQIPGYEFIRRDRNRQGGGVGFYIKTSINFGVRSDLNAPSLENLCIEIRKPNSRPFLIATWYRPPCSSIDLFLPYESFLEKLDSLGLEYYLLGDLNCNLASAQYDLNTRRLCEISDLFGLQQLITEPTRITESSSTLIDLIYTNYTDRVVCSGVSHIGISDHSLIYVYRKLSLTFPSKGHSTISYRNFQNFNRESFRNDIAQQDWSYLEDVCRYQ